ncbi:MAG: UDP-N-acetylmuramoyl-L-alanyl-D-glutamate synthetase [Fibrobacterota bacterium]|jgi:UDP-N-acetylmuramoylalanine-D-glutamate ligase
MTVVATSTEIRIPRTVVVSGADLRFACAHLLRRLAEGIPVGGRAPEILEASPGRAIPNSADFVVEADATRPDLLGTPGVRSAEAREIPGESVLDWSWSLDRPVWKGAYLRHGLLIAANEGRAHVLGPVRNLRIPGTRHLEAVLPALAAALSWGVDPKTLRELVFSWTGPSHTLQWAGHNRGITLFDDGSCCTSEGLARALGMFDQKVTLVTGGPGFHAGFELLERVRSGASRIVLLPGTPDWIVSAWSQLSDVRRAADLKVAAVLARECTPAGGQVLFSPGCFPNELEHGVTRRGFAFAEEFLDA